jgi:hypothetical protein
VSEHFPEIEAEACLAEGGGVARRAGTARYAMIQTMENRPSGARLAARGPSGHGARPMRGNAIAHLSGAVKGWPTGTLLCVRRTQRERSSKKWARSAKGKKRNDSRRRYVRFPRTGMSPCSFQFQRARFLSTTTMPAPRCFTDPTTPIGRDKSSLSDQTSP